MTCALNLNILVSLPSGVRAVQAQSIIMGRALVGRYDFLQQFFKAHPQYQKNDFYTFGESYAGH